MKLIGAAFGVAAMMAVGAAAQTQTADKPVDVEKKIEVKDGKDITVTGCLKRNPGGGFMITDGAGELKYALVTNDDMSNRIGQEVEVKGIATDKGEATVSVESAVGTSGVIGETQIKATDKATREMKGAIGLHYLAMKSIKMNRSSRTNSIFGPARRSNSLNCSCSAGAMMRCKARRNCQSESRI